MKIKVNIENPTTRLVCVAAIAVLSALAAIIAGVAFLQFVTPFIRLQIEALQSDILVATSTVLTLLVIRGAYLYCYRRSVAAYMKPALKPADPS